MVLVPSGCCSGNAGMGFHACGCAAHGVQNCLAMCGDKTVGRHKGAEDSDHHAMLADRRDNGTGLVVMLFDVEFLIAQGLESPPLAGDLSGVRRAKVG